MKEYELFMKLFDFSRATYYKRSKEKLPALELLKTYFTTSELEEFLENGYISSRQKQPDTLNPYLEDHIIHNLKRTHNLNRSFYSILFPGSEFLTRHLRDLTTENLSGLTIANAKDRLKSFLSSVKLSKFLDSEQKREKVIEEIDDKFSDVEIYLILKYPDKFVQ